MRKPILMILLLALAGSAWAQAPVRETNSFSTIVGGSANDKGSVMVVNPDGSINTTTTVDLSGATITGGGASQNDRSALADGSGKINPIAGCFNETSTNPTEDQAACVRLTSKRGLHTSIRREDGTELGVVANPLYIQGTVALGAGSAIIGHVIVDSGGGGGVADEAAFTFGTTQQVPFGCVFQTTATNNALTTGQSGAVQCTAQRAPFVNLRNASGTEIGTSGAPLRTDPTGTTIQPVSGTVTANAGTGNFTVAQGTGTNLHTVVDSGTITSLTQMNGQAIAMGTGTRSAGTQRVTIATDDIVPASQSGTWNITNISGTISLPTGAATSANQTTANTSLSSIATNTTGLVTDAHFQALALAAGGTTSGTLGHMGFCAVTTSAPSYTTAQNNFLSCDLNGGLRVNTARLDAALDKVSVGVAVSGGSTPFKLISAATTNATNVKASPGQIYHMQLVNLSGSTRFVKLYNTASAPTCNSSTVVKTIPVFASAGALLDYEEGLEFLTGISFCVTGALADNDNTAISANDIVVAIDYK